MFGLGRQLLSPRIQGVVPSQMVNVSCFSYQLPIDLQVRTRDPLRRTNDTPTPSAPSSPLVIRNNNAGTRVSVFSDLKS
jgi:hypothetical protein